MGQSASQLSTVLQIYAFTRIITIPKFYRKELGKFINTDEAPALGAVYQAASMTKGFKVKKFIIKDANLFPIQVGTHRSVKIFSSLFKCDRFWPVQHLIQLVNFQVDFNRESEEENADPTRVIHRTLFNVANPYPMKKVMTFNKHTKDFEFRVNYGHLKYLTKEQLR